MARDLYFKALAAQGDGNLEEALKDLEAIRKMPAFVWQADLEVRVANLKRDLGR